MTSSVAQKRTGLLATKLGRVRQLLHLAPDAVDGVGRHLVPLGDVALKVGERLAARVELGVPCGVRQWVTRVEQAATALDEPTHVVEDVDITVV